MSSHQVIEVGQIPIIKESVVDFWESIPRDWPNHKFDVMLSNELDQLFKNYALEQRVEIQKIIDCGCGTGNPSIGLAESGYQVFCVDSDPNMVERFKINCSAANTDLRVITSDWRDLNGEILDNGPFDAAICRGNSLIYAGCWERDAFIPQVAEKAIKNSLKHIASVLKPGGLFYVDITSRIEYADLKPKFEFVGMRETDTHYVLIYWLNDYKPETRTRRVHARRLFESKSTGQLEKVTEYMFTGYMLYHDELQQLATDVGFSLVKAYPKVDSEWLYDVFLFSRG